MELTNEGVVVVIAVGIVAGLIAGNYAWSSGFGFFGDMAIGIVGSFIGDELFPETGIHLVDGLGALIADAAAGAVALLLLMSVVFGGLGRHAWWSGRPTGWRRPWLNRQ